MSKITKTEIKKAVCLVNVAKAMWNSGPDSEVKWEVLDESLKKEFLAMAKAGIEQYNKLTERNNPLPKQ